MTRETSLNYLNLAHFLDHFFLLIFPTAVIAIERAWQLTYGEALALATPMYVAFALATLPAGWLGDHLNRRTLLSVFFAGCGCAAIATGLATGPFGIAVGLALLGMFTAIYHPVGLALVIEVAVKPGRALSVNGVFGNLGLAASALLTGWLTQYAGWRSAFIVPGLLSLAIGVAFTWQSRRRTLVATDAAAQAGAQFTPVARSVQYRVFAIVLVSAICGGFIFNAVTVTLPKVFDERLLASGIDLSAIGGFTALVFGVAAFAQLPVGHLLDRFGARPVLIGLLIPQVCVLLLLAGSTGGTVVPLAMVLVVLMFAEVPITSWLMGHFVAPAWRARAISVEYMLSLGLGALVVPLIAWGHSAGYGFAVQFRALAVSAAIVLIAALFLPAWQRRSPTLASEGR